MKRGSIICQIRPGQKTSADMTGCTQSWIKNYPIVSIEDGLEENDWDGFRAAHCGPGR